MTSAVWWPCKRCLGLKFLVLQMIMVRSAELVASHLPSGLNVQQRTLSSWPVRVCWRDPTKSFLDEDPPMFTTLIPRPHLSYYISPTHLMGRYHIRALACVARMHWLRALHHVPASVLATIVTRLVNFWIWSTSARGWKRPTIDIKHITKLGIRCQPRPFQWPLLRHIH